MANIFSSLFSKLNPIKKEQPTGNTAGNVAQNLSSIYTPYSPQSKTANVFVQKSTPIYKTIGTAAPAIKTLVGTGNGEPGKNIPSAPTSNAVKPSYDTDYANYLKNRTAKAMTMAEQQKALQDQVDQQAYEYARRGLLQNQTNLSNLLSTNRARSAEDMATLKATAERQKTNATTASGASQRSLMETRRQLAGQREKQYAALGTIDSAGTGSFQQANANDDTAFIRMTNENQQALNDKLYEIDDTITKAQFDATRRLQDQETQYNQAVVEINRQLANNEQLRGIAIQQATQLLEQKKAEIQDEFDSLTLQAQQQKLTYQQELDKMNAQSEQIAQLFTDASPEFKKYGQITTPNDMILVNRYPDVYKSMLEGVKNAGANPGGVTQEQLNTMQDIKDVLDSNNLNNIVGLSGKLPWNWLPGSTNYQTSAIFNRIKNAITLAQRKKLTGQGQISDFETKLLQNASTILDPNQSPEAITAALTQLYNELQTGQRQSIYSSSNNNNPLGI